MAGGAREEDENHIAGGAAGLHTRAADVRGARVALGQERTRNARPGHLEELPARPVRPVEEAPVRVRMPRHEAVESILSLHARASVSS